MRGLKYTFFVAFHVISNVALYMSAWIEIFPYGCTQLFGFVALYMSAWIEIVLLDSAFNSKKCRTHMSTLIEIGVQDVSDDKRCRRTLHECED
ncbi:hypothetical protein BPJM79_90066 [Bacillus pumilus]